MRLMFLRAWTGVRLVKEVPRGNASGCVSLMRSAAVDMKAGWRPFEVTVEEPPRLAKRRLRLVRVGAA